MAQRVGPAPLETKKGPEHRDEPSSGKDVAHKMALKPYKIMTD